MDKPNWIRESSHCLRRGTFYEIYIIFGSYSHDVVTRFDFSPQMIIVFSCRLPLNSNRLGYLLRPDNFL